MAIQGPRCCGEYMQRWQDESYNTKKITQHWMCDHCGKQKPLFQKPWCWFWAVVTRAELEDRFFNVPWWMGSVSNNNRFLSQEFTFTVIPLNRIISWALGFYLWARLSPSSQIQKSMIRAFRAGQKYGHRRELLR